MVIGSRQKLKTQTDKIVDVRIEGKEIKTVNFSKSIVVYIDDTLSWRKHTNEISKKISGIGALKRVRPLILDLQSIPRELNNKDVAAMLVELTIEANEESFVIVHQHGGNDVTCKSRIGIQQRKYTRP